MNDTDVIDTSGFYKNEGGQLLHAPNVVEGPEYVLLRQYVQTYPLPLPDGWVWFDTEAAARAAFGLPAVDSAV